MKYLLTLVLVCALLCGCSGTPLLTTTIPMGAAEKTPDSELPGDVTGTPIPTGDGRKLFYSTGWELRVWDRELGIHRKIRELGSLQQLTGVLLEGAVLQCEDGNDTFFYAAFDGQLLQSFEGSIRVETDKEGYSAVIPLGDLTLGISGQYNDPPRMVLGDGEPEIYFPAHAPDTEGLSGCRETARQLEEVYGIGILLWDEVPEAAANIREHLVPVIRRELAVLEQRLSVFPEKMLQETAAHFPRLSICLVRERSSSLPCSHFREEEQPHILLESGHSGEALYHALFHAMETHILGNSKALDRWMELNPAGFAYDEDYTANKARDSGIYLFGEHQSFVNRFSMSYPREDRAEIFARAMMPGSEALFEKDAIQKKLAALCAGIREAYQLENYDGVLPWEQYLE